MRHSIKPELKAEISLTKRLAEDVQAQVKVGLFPDLNSLVVEAVRRYLDTHHGDMNEQFIRRDVEWGLCGDD
jgi:Arc/MetJ-type ribon-helix-helix transcriptional regulator